MPGVVVSANSTFTYAAFGALLAEDGSWSDDTVTCSYANRMRRAIADRWQEQLSYAYDGAGNVLYRTNHALVQSFGVNNLNQLTNQSRSGKLTVAEKVFQKTPQQCPHSNRE